MDVIHKLPFILGCLAAMVVGSLSYYSGSGSQTVFLRMAFFMVIFFMMGVYIRNTVLSIKDEIKEKENKRRKEEEQRILEEQELQYDAAMTDKPQQGQKAKSQQHNGQNVDLVAEDTDEEFQPLTVSRVISSQLKE